MKTTYILLAVLAVVAIGGAVYTMRPVTSPLPTDTPATSSTPQANSTVTNPITSLSTNPTTMPSPTPQSSITPIQQTVQATLKTSLGTIELELNGAVAPLAVGNFVQLARSGFYNGVTFHRVIPNFMIQAGDPLSKDPTKRAEHGTGGPGYTFKTELNDQKFVRGSVGVARTQQLDTNGSQFFLVTGAAVPSLDGQYTNFGMVKSGMDVVDAISHVQRDQKDNPLQPVTIESVTIK